MKRLALILVVIALVGCGKDAPKQGHVINKAFRPAYDDTYYVSQCVSYNSKGFCQVSVPIPYTDHHPDAWKLDLRNCWEENNGKQKCDEGWLNVDQGTWDRYKVGDYFGASSGAK